MKSLHEITKKQAAIGTGAAAALGGAGYAGKRFLDKGKAEAATTTKTAEPAADEAVKLAPRPLETTTKAGETGGSVVDDIKAGIGKIKSDLKGDAAFQANIQKGKDLFNKVKNSAGKESPDTEKSLMQQRGEGGTLLGDLRKGFKKIGSDLKGDKTLQSHIETTKKGWQKGGSGREAVSNATDKTLAAARDVSGTVAKAGEKIGKTAGETGQKLGTKAGAAGQEFGQKLFSKLQKLQQSADMIDVAVAAGIGNKVL